MGLKFYHLVSISLMLQRPYTSTALSPVNDAWHLNHINLHRVVNDAAFPIVVRQAPASHQFPTTNTPECDKYDHYLYVTGRNYTWQLQCSTSYEGSVIQQTETANYSACIGICIDYNRAHYAGSCLAITFNGPGDGAQGLCSQYSDVQSEFVAYEEGNVQDSALLVYGPNGTQFATPLPDASFAGEPTHPPTVIPVPSSTSISTPRASTTSSTTTIRISSCSANTFDCFNPGQWSSPVSTTSGNMTLSTRISSSYNGSPSPSTSDTITAPTNTILSQVQESFTSAVPFTEYRVQLYESCATISTSTTCTHYSTTYSVTGYRTHLSCSPGVCRGVKVATGSMTDMAAKDSCVATV